MGGLGVSFLVRRARSSWLLLACVAVTVLLTTGLAAVLWTFAAGVIPPGALSILAAPQGRVIGLTGVADAGEGGLRLAADPGHAAQGLARGRFPAGKRAVDEPATAPVVRHERELRADPGRVAGRDQRPGHADRRDMAWAAAPRRSGARGAAGRRGQPAAPDGRLGADGHPVAGGAPTSLRVTGLFRPTNPASPYWALDLLPVSGISVQGYTIGTAGNQATRPGTASATAPRW